jgi:hypothetical protein
MEWRYKRAEWLKKSPAAKSLIPDPTRKFLIDKMEDYTFADTEASGHAINHYLYLSTMGANLGPASKNIFQNPLTLIPMKGMGVNAWAEGIRKTTEKSALYLADVGKGMKAEAAFEKNFGDFVEMMGPQSSMMSRMFGAEAPGVGLAEHAKGFIQKAEDLAMAPFKFTELWVNRMPAFYGAKSRALSWGATAAQANRIAANVVDTAHFIGGPLGMPAGVMDYWSPARQFMQFPTRYAGFLANSAYAGGKLDLSTISKAMAASAGIYTVGRDILGMDLSGGLLMGALPVPQYENSPFYPFPLVPPIAQLAGNVVQGIATGKAQPVLDAATLLIPGGLAARRLQRTLGPKKADYQNRLPDGRIPVYNEAGSLVGAYTALQLSLRAIGVMPNDVAKERAAAVWLAKQRDQIRGYRRKWLEAVAANDAVEQDRIQGQFAKQYPELGPMQVKKTDLKALQNRRQTSRINRVMRGFPSAYRPLFQNIVAETELQDFTQNLPTTAIPSLAMAG